MDLVRHRYDRDLFCRKALFQQLPVPRIHHYRHIGLPRMENKTNEMIRRIAITGPESTGKSMLAQQLADHYHTLWVPEFARDYLTSLNRPYEEDDILYIARQ